MVKQRGEGLGHFELGNLTCFIDVELLEESLVESPTDAWYGSQVLLVAGGRDDQRLMQDAFDARRRGLSTGNRQLGGGLLFQDTLHLGFHQFERNGSGVVGLEQLLLLIFYISKLFGGTLHLAFNLDAVGAELLKDGLLYLPSPLSCEMDAVIELLNTGFDLVQPDRTLIAGMSFDLLGNAVEVLVDSTSAAVATVDEATAALSTEDTALEIVLILELFVTRDAMCGQDLLHPQPQLHIHESIVFAFVEDATEWHHTEVVGVAEHEVETVDGQRLGRPFGGWSRGQALSGECFKQPRQGPATEGVLLEGPPDKRRPLVIHGDRADDDAIDDILAVEVTQRWAARGTTKLGLRRHALHDFHGQVVRMVLGDSSEHAVEQLASRRFIDRLSDRHELGPSAEDLGVDSDVIRSVSRKPVNLMNNHEVDALGLELSEHELQLWPVCRLGTLTGVDVFGDHHSTELASLL